METSTPGCVEPMFFFHAFYVDLLEFTWDFKDWILWYFIGIIRDTMGFYWDLLGCKHEQTEIV